MSAAVRPDTPCTVALVIVMPDNWPMFCDDENVANDTGVDAAGPENDGEAGARVLTVSSTSAIAATSSECVTGSAGETEAPRTSPLETVEGAAFGTDVELPMFG